jgi:hypothetical protein
LTILRFLTLINGRVYWFNRFIPLAGPVSAAIAYK